MRAHTPPAPSPPTPHHPGLATTHTWLHFLNVQRVFKGCQCVPTPPRALTTPTAHTPPGPRFLATTQTWLAFSWCLESI